MNNVKVLLHRLFRHRPLYYIIAFATGAVIAGLCLLRGGLNARITWVDAFTVAGAVVILLGLLSAVSHYGAFDIFGYSFSVLGNRRYASLFEYSEAKKEKRGKDGLIFMPFIAVGALYLLAGLLIWAL